MNIYWFSDEDGHYWEVIVAKNEQEAWEIFSQTSPNEETVEELKKRFELVETTAIGKESGEIATIFPLEVGFYIEEKPSMD